MSAIEIAGLRVWYGDALAVRGVDLTVAPGEVRVLIGESGCGKSSLALASAGLLAPGTRVEGSVRLRDAGDILYLSRKQLRAVRGTRLGYVPQDALAALNPMLSVGRQLAEVFEFRQPGTRGEHMAKAIDVLRRVRISEPERVARLYPHQLSGGMRQRVLIAIAVALSPQVLIADEPTTALDVSTEAEILALVDDLRRDLGAAVLWITHDMGVVAEFADSVSVMYAGRIVEEGPVGAIFDAPAHPYTRALLRTLHDVSRGAPGTPLFQIEGQPPTPEAPPSGCRFPGAAHRRSISAARWTRRRSRTTGAWLSVISRSTARWRPDDCRP